jgi:AcrR family transcriptional regulator
MGALNPDSIFGAGQAVVRESGWTALSLRAVASRLGVTPMALYRHVDDGAALTRGVIGRIAAEIGEVGRTGDARRDLEAWARTAHSILREHPGAAGHLLVVWFEVPAMLRCTEDLLDVVHHDGLREFEAVAAVNAVVMYVLMRCEAEQAVRGAGAVKRTLKLAAAESPLPHLTSLAAHYTTARFDVHFEYGLEVLLDGIAARRVAP